ncbi:Rv3654c family TadE-like protein [Streptomyces antibioticus]|uniref:Rv3654c family TadE-like protein n=1 Tax=Streptomyces antibioticus TaxID=1890 RepID=UPI003F4D2C4C
MRAARGRGDEGSATVLSLAVIAVLCVVFGALLAYGQAVVIRHRAAGGADLAALAAADHWADGERDACARAGRVARAQGVRLVRCMVVGEITDVTAASGQGPFRAEARARAGPPEPAPAPLPTWSFEQPEHPSADQPPPPPPRSPPPPPPRSPPPPPPRSPPPPPPRSPETPGPRHSPQEVPEARLPSPG